VAHPPKKLCWIGCSNERGGEGSNVMDVFWNSGRTRGELKEGSFKMLRNGVNCDERGGEGSNVMDVFWNSGRTRGELKEGSFKMLHNGVNCVVRLLALRQTRGGIVPALQKLEGGLPWDTNMYQSKIGTWLHP
jgi:hypothetical protein